MSRHKRQPTPIIEAHLLREGIVESTHQAQAVICDHRGRVLSCAGDPRHSSFIRSALKPFQALAIVGSGTLETYELGDQDLAVVCSSHQGTIEQARQVFNILWRADLEPSMLQCPIPAGKTSPLEHNCSGKHAGMLAVCQQRHWPLHTYMDRSHPVQQLILDKIGELLGLPGAELLGVHDDCGVPTYHLELQQMATLYAQLAAGTQLELERVVRAMTYHPTMVAGPGAFDTELMRLTEGELVSKAGAEGVQCVGRVGEGMGLAIKVQDGAKRAKYAIALHLLTALGWISPAVADSLAEQFLVLNDYKRIEVAGELTLT